MSISLFQTLGKVIKEGVIDLGLGNYADVGQVTEELGSNIMQQGLRYSDDATTNEIVNQYLSNINRGSALTKGAKQIQQTPLGKLNVPVGSVPFEEIGAEIDITTTNQTQPINTPIKTFSTHCHDIFNHIQRLKKPQHHIPPICYQVRRRNYAPILKTLQLEQKNGCNTFIYCEQKKAKNWHGRK